MDNQEDLNDDRVQKVGVQIEIITLEDETKENLVNATINEGSEPRKTMVTKKEYVGVNKYLLFTLYLGLLRLMHYFIIYYFDT